MHRHWEEFGPPVYIAAAAYLGIGKAKERKEEQERDPEDPDGMGELLNMFGGGGVI